MKTLLYRLVTLNYFYKPNHEYYRQICFNNVVLLLMSFVFLFFTLINTFVIHNPLVALVDFIGFLFSIGLYTYFFKTKNYAYTVQGTVLILIIMLLVYLSVRGHQSYALIWMSTLPLLAYFLLGWKKGMTMSFLFYFVVFLSAINKTAPWLYPGFDLNAGLNVVLASLSIIVGVTYYEFSRQSAYDALKISQQELEILHVTDQLTQIKNRIALDHYFLGHIELLKDSINPPNSEFHDNQLSIILIDVDHFKYVNDTHGHLVGDQVLYKVAQILSSVCRKNDLIGRWGGEEFLVICPQTNLEDALIVAERMRIAVENLTYNIESLKVSISLGIATYQIGDTVEKMMKRADLALYKAKGNGRNQWSYEKPDRVNEKIDY
jgi:diguanylate cyclase (GGDEF)-like protein